jgi:hypothetical protein
MKNMGRNYWDKKDTVEDCKGISFSFLRKDGYLCNNRSEIYWTNSITGKETDRVGITVSITEAEKFVRFQYTIIDCHTKKKTDYDYKVQLTTTPCKFGGVRYWFICPFSRNGVYCGRRVAKLYKAPGESSFACRHCNNLSYESRNECRIGRFGQLGYFFKAKRQCEDLRNKIKRRTWRGKPTKKVQKLCALEQKTLTSSLQALAHLGGLEPHD